MNRMRVCMCSWILRKNVHRVVQVIDKLSRILYLRVWVVKGGLATRKRIVDMKDKKTLLITVKTTGQLVFASLTSARWFRYRFTQKYVTCILQNFLAAFIYSLHFIPVIFLFYFLFLFFICLFIFSSFSSFFIFLIVDYMFFVNCNRLYFSFIICHVLILQTSSSVCKTSKSIINFIHLFSFSYFLLFFFSFCLFISCCRGNCRNRIFVHEFDFMGWSLRNTVNETSKRIEKENGASKIYRRCIFYLRRLTLRLSFQPLSFQQFYRASIQMDSKTLIRQQKENVKHRYYSNEH